MKLLLDTHIVLWAAGEDIGNRKEALGNRNQEIGKRIEERG